MADEPNPFGDLPDAPVVRQDPEAERNPFGDVAINKLHSPLQEYYNRIAGGTPEMVGSAVSAIPTLARLAPFFGDVYSVAAGGQMPEDYGMPQPKKTPEELQAELERDPIYQAGEELRRGGRLRYETDPAYENTYMGRLTSAIGQTIPSAALYGIPGGGAVAGGLLYAGGQAEQERKAAVAAGDLKDADEVFAVAALAGFGSEMLLGAGPWFWRGIRKLRRAGVTPEEASSSIKRFALQHPIVSRTAQGVAREESQELLEQWGLNIEAGRTYDPGRKQTEGFADIVTTMLPLGGIPGFALGTAEAIIREPLAVTTGDASKRRTDVVVNQSVDQMPKTAATVQAMQNQADSDVLFTEQDLAGIRGRPGTATVGTAEQAQAALEGAKQAAVEGTIADEVLNKRATLVREPLTDTEFLQRKYPGMPEDMQRRIIALADSRSEERFGPRGPEAEAARTAVTPTEPATAAPAATPTPAPAPAAATISTETTTTEVPSAVSESKPVEEVLRPKEEGTGEGVGLRGVGEEKPTVQAASPTEEKVTPEAATAAAVPAPEAAAAAPTEPAAAAVPTTEAAPAATTPETTAAQPDKILAALDRAIEATSGQGMSFGGIAGLSYAVANAALKIARQAYVTTKDVAHAVNEAIKYIQTKLTPDEFDEAKVRQAIEAAVIGEATQPQGPPGQGRTRAQVFGRPGVGAESDVVNVAETTAGVRANFFNGHTEISDANTDKAWRLARAWINPETSEATSRAAADSGAVSEDPKAKAMSGTIAQAELFHYALVLAGQKNTDLLGYLLNHVNTFEIFLGGGGSSAVGAAMRGLREMNSPLWKSYNEVYKERDKQAGAAVGQEVVEKLKKELEQTKLTVLQLQEALENAKTTGGTSLADALNEAMGIGKFDSEDPVFLSFLRAVIQTGKRKLTTLARPDLINRIQGMFPLMNMRKFLEQYGGKALSDEWWKLLSGGKEKEEGPLTAADKALQGELRNLLREALDRLGLVKEGEKEKISSASKLAMILGKGELREGKVREVDKLVRQEMAARQAAEIEAVGDNADAVAAINEKYEALGEAWDETMSSMAADPASKSFLRRMIHEKVKQSKLNWNEIIKNPDAANAARERVINEISKDVQDAATNKLDLGPVHAALGEVFDEIVSIRKAKRDAYLAKLEAEKPERAAQGIVDRLARSQSDTLSWPAKIKNAVQEIVSKALKVDFVPDADAFRAQLQSDLVAVGVKASTAETMANLIWRERQIRQRVKESEAARREAEKPEKTARRFLDKLAESQSDTLSWPEKIKNAVQEILSKAMAVNAQFRGSENLFKAALTHQLVQAGVKPATSDALANAAWRERQLREGVRNFQEGQRLAEKGSLRPIINAILSAPLADQNSKQWRMTTMLDFFKQRGMSTEQAQTAARVFDKVFEKRLAEAQRETAKLVLQEESVPWQKKARSDNPSHRSRAQRELEATQRAIRAGLTDPASAVVDALALENGWAGFTKEQHERLAKLDSIINDEKTQAYEAGQAISEMQRIVTSVKLPPTPSSILAAAFTWSALSGTGTAGINVIAPLLEHISRYVTYVASNFGRPGGLEAILNATNAFVKSFQTLAFEFSWAIKNDVYIKHDLIAFGGGAGKTLQLALRDGIKDVRSGEPQRVAKGLIKSLFASQDFVRRFLSAMDSAWMLTSEEFSRQVYSQDLLRSLGYDISSIQRLNQGANSIATKSYQDALNRGMSTADAKMHSISAVREAFYSGLVDWVGQEQAQHVVESVEKDAELLVGIHDDPLKNPEGFLSEIFGANKLLSMVSELKAQGPYKAMAAQAIYGFVGVPFRLVRYGAYYTPYGLIRYGIRKYGKTNHWEQSMATDLQARQRLYQAIGGSLFATVLATMMSSTGDDDDDKDFALHITGFGPPTGDRAYRDAWMKKHKAYAIEFKLGGARVFIPYGRGFGEALVWPLAMVGAIDDYLLKRGKQVNAARELNAGWEWAGAFVSAMANRGAFFGLHNLKQTFTPSEANVAGNITWSLSPVIPWVSFMRSVERVFTDLPDKTSVKGAVFANLPVFRSIGTLPALNGLGDPISDNTLGGRAWFSGLPFLFRIPETPANRDVYGLILAKQQAPPTPNRPQVERKYGALTDPQWYDYMRIRGQETKREMLARMRELTAMDAQQFDAALNQFSSLGDGLAARRLHLQPVRKVKARAAAAVR